MSGSSLFRKGLRLVLLSLVCRKRDFSICVEMSVWGICLVFDPQDQISLFDFSID